MKRIWINHWFSTAYNIINLITDENEDFYIVGSNDSDNASYKSLCDEWYIEPILDEVKYVDFCLKFCNQHDIDIFMPRRGMIEISKRKEEFNKIGTQVMVEDFEIMEILNDKEKAYQFFKGNEIVNIPNYRIVTSKPGFVDAYNMIKEEYGHVCFKFANDEGGKSYRLIDNTRKGYYSLKKKQNTRMTLDNVLEALAEKEEYDPIMVMPYLSGNEVSVDCLKTEAGIIMIPRIKGNTRVEEIAFDKSILDMCEEIYSKLNLEWPCNIQFKYLNDVPYFLEVNTRMSGGVQLSCAACGVNIPNIAVNKILGISRDWEIHQVGKYVSHVELPLVF